MRPKRNHHSSSDRPTYAPTRAVQRTSSPTWCAKHGKRKYTSRAQALKAGEQKYGMRSNAYVCACGSWHLTRRDTRLDVRRVSETSANEAANALVAALLGGQAANDDGGEG